MKAQVKWIAFSCMLTFIASIPAKGNADSLQQAWLTIPDSLLDEDRPVHIDQIAHVNLRNWTWVFRDSLGKHTIEQVSRTGQGDLFQPLEIDSGRKKNPLYVYERTWPAGGDQPPRGSEAIWLRLRLQGNQHAHQYYHLYVSAVIDQVEVYEKTGNDIRRTTVLGNQ